MYHALRTVKNHWNLRLKQLCEGNLRRRDHIRSVQHFVTLLQYCGACMECICTLRRRLMSGVRGEKFLKPFRQTLLFQLQSTFPAFHPFRPFRSIIAELIFYITCNCWYNCPNQEWNIFHWTLSKQQSIIMLTIFVNRNAKFMK